MLVKEAIILAGGKGTRLRSVLKNLPKPMAQIQNKPFLEILIEHFNAKGIQHFVLSVGYMSDTIIEHFKNRYRDIDISFSIENEPLGTGGAVSLAFKKVKGEIALVLNGDSLFDVDIKKLKLYHSTDLPIIYGRYVDDVTRFGHFVCKKNKVVSFKEKMGKGSGFINGGVYVFKKDTLASFPSNKNFSIERDFFSKFTTNNTATIIFSNSFFIDIGVPESLQKAQVELLPFIHKT